MRKGFFTSFLILTVILSLFGTTAHGAISDGLAAHYSFMEGSGTILHDSTPNNYHGAINNALWTAGPVSGYSLQFNGIGGSVNVPQYNSLQTLTQGSISVWFYYDGIPSGNAISPILYMGEANGFNNFLVIEAGHNDVTNEKLYFTLAVNGGLILCFDSNVNLIKGRWYHFVAVVGENSNTGYLNGVEMTDRHYNYGDSTTQKFFADIPVKEKFAIGRGTTLAAKSNSSFFTFNGRIGETRIYNRPLSSSEVAQLYNLK